METLERKVKIRQNIVGERESIVISQKEYGEFLLYQKNIQKINEEEKDTDEAIKTYKKEKKEGRSKKIKSLAELV